MKLLFICSRNRRRSLTAEVVFKKDERFSVKSAGTERSARIRANRRLIDWADRIFVMEKRHLERLTQSFKDLIIPQNVIVLDIPDEYQYMDEELAEMLKDSVEYYLGGQ